MTVLEKGLTNRLLGYPPDARLLIINADDFGMCNAVNQAIIKTLEAGVVRSTTLMVPYPWAFQAIHFLTGHPGTPFGIHLTAISDPDIYRWGPVTPWDQVPDLVDQSGHFHNFETMHSILANLDLIQLEKEFRAQIETVFSSGLKPTHLDWHALRIANRPDIFDVLIRLANEYGLALRVYGNTVIEKLQGQGLPVIDFDFLDSYNLDPANKPDRYTQLLRELPEGLSEWAVHPGMDSPELLAMEPEGHHFRQADLDFFTAPGVMDLVRKQGIVLLDYRPLQAVWKEK